MTKNDRYLKLITLAMIVTLTISMLAACSGGASEDASDTNKVSADDAFAGREYADVSGYEALEDYDKETVFVETTVAEVKEMMDAKKTFVLFCSFEACPWCNLLIPYLNDAALDAGMSIGYIDTRSNPEWTNNMDIDDYDVFTDIFKKWLSKDEDGKLHLYVPDTYFIKDGKVVAHHDGVTPGADDPSNELSSEQEEQLRKDLADEFAALN